ncbi:MAG: hypothetical protein WA708_07000 [Acidobacteriaceae bacterium]
MSPSIHLDEEVFILIANRELAPELQSTAAAHLKGCSQCRERLRNLQQWRFELAALPLESAIRKAPVRASAAHIPRAAHVASIAVLTLIALTAVLWPRKSNTPVEAKEMVDRAVEFENLHPNHGRYLQANLPAGACDLESSDPPCVQLARKMSDAHWDVRSPSAAHTFKAWHDSLHQWRDSVVEDKDTKTLTTETASGLLRAASLSVRKDDFAPIEATLKFADATSISITEKWAPLLPALPVRLAARRDIAAALPIAPADAAEIGAWRALHSLQADNGWEASVVRDGHHVIVRAIVPNAARREAIRASVAAIANVQTSIRLYGETPQADEDVLPQRPPSGDAPPLLADWLREHYPDPSSRDTFSNTVLEDSRIVLGHAYVVSQLDRASRRIPHPAVSELSAIEFADRNRLHLSLAKLVDDLQPLLGQTHPRSVISEPDAMKVDQLLRQMLEAGKEDSLSADSSTKDLQQLLTK